MKQQFFTDLAICTTVFFWGSAFVGIRYGLQDFSPGVLALFRYLVASVVMVFIYWRIPNKKMPTVKEVPFVFILGVLGIGIYNITLNIGEVTVSAGVSGFIVSQFPVVTIVLAQFVLHERLSKLGWIGFAVSIFGVVLIALGEESFGHIDHGVWYIIISTLCVGTYSTFQKFLLKKFNSLEIASWIIWSGTCAMLGYVHPMIHEVAHASWHAIWVVVYLGLFPASLAYACWSYGMKHCQACRAASFLYGMPIVAVILGWILLGEQPSLLSLAGGAIALFGAMLIRKK